MPFLQKSIKFPFRRAYLDPDERYLSRQKPPRWNNNVVTLGVLSPCLQTMRHSRSTAKFPSFWMLLFTWILLIISTGSLLAEAIKIEINQDMHKDTSIERLARSFSQPRPSISNEQSIYLPTTEECISDIYSFTRDKGCRCHLFQSNPSEFTHGVFKSPSFEMTPRSKYDCLVYTFVGDVGEIVELVFERAKIEADPITKRCTDYVRIYDKLERAELSLEDVPDYELCGPITVWPKKQFLSKDRVLILEIQLMSSTTDSDYGFFGNFYFRKKKTAIINDRIETVPSLCSRDIFRNSFVQEDLVIDGPCNVKFISLDSNERVYLRLQSNHYRNETESGQVCRQYRDVERFALDRDYLTLNLTMERISLNSLTCIDLFSLGNQFLGELKHDPRGINILYKFYNPTSVAKHKSSKRFIDLDKVHDSGKIETAGFPSGYETSFDQLFQFSYPKEGFLELKFEVLSIGFINGVSDIFCKTEYHDKIEVYQDAKLVLALCQRYHDKYIFWKNPEHIKSFTYVPNSRKLILKPDNVLIKLFSDNARNGPEKGFQLTYQYIPTTSVPGKQQLMTKPPPDDFNSKNDCLFRVEASLRKENLNRIYSSPESLEQVARNNSTLCRLQIIGKPGYRIKLMLKPKNQPEEDNKSYWKHNKISPSNSVQSDQESRLTLPQKILRCADEKALKVYSFETDLVERPQGQEMLTVCENYDGSTRGELQSTSVLSSSISRLDVEMQADVDQMGRSRIKNNDLANRFGYEIEYLLVKDFGVQTSNGHQVDDQCLFEFFSTESTTGHFTSPNFSGTYPNNLTCTYVMIGNSWQQILVSFKQFNVEHSTINCNNENGDYVEIRSCHDPQRLLAPRLCQRQTAERQILFNSTESCIKLIFKTNDKYVRDGFFGYYQFIPKFYHASNGSPNPCPPFILLAILNLIIKLFLP